MLLSLRVSCSEMRCCVDVCIRLVWLLSELASWPWGFDVSHWKALSGYL